MADARPFEILGLQQVAIGGTDKEALHRLWVGLLGVAITGHFRSEAENVDEDIAELGAGPGRVELDLMVPIERVELTPASFGQYR